LLDYIQHEYGIDGTCITPAKRGYYGETWRLYTADTSYFLKLVYPAAHKIIYERSFPVIQHLCDHGISFISQIVKTKSGDLFAQYDDAILGVFEWIDGKNIETNETKIPEYQMMAKIYTIPVHGLTITREDFSYKNADKFFEQWHTLDNAEICSLLEKYRAKLEHRAKRLKYFSTLCSSDTTGFFITHGDAGGNLLMNDDKYFIVDWDHPILAPPERDAWVMCSHEWTRNAFQDAMYQNGIIHTLRSERLGYYCYQFFFFYLTAFLDGFAQAGTIEEYLNCWIEESIKYVERKVS